MSRIVETRTATYKRTSVCPCGFHILRDDVPIGRKYDVIPETVKNALMVCGGCRAILNLKIIFTMPSPTGTAGWIPFDLFELEGEQKGAEHGN